MQHVPVAAGDCHPLHYTGQVHAVAAQVNCRASIRRERNMTALSAYGGGRHNRPNHRGFRLTRQLQSGGDLRIDDNGNHSARARILRVDQYTTVLKGYPVNKLGKSLRKVFNLEQLFPPTQPHIAVKTSNHAGSGANLHPNRHNFGI